MLTKELLEIGKKDPELLRAIVIICAARRQAMQMFDRLIELAKVAPSTVKELAKQVSKSSK